jgi:hypothetical protein
VFHDYGQQANGHGNNEWFKRQRDRFRQASLVRAKTILQMPGGEADINDQANLGIYGLGKRRSLEQLSAFTGLNFNGGRGHVGKFCAGKEWVPYDSSISPTENLFTNPDNLDPQPEYLLRTNLIYYHPTSMSQSLLLPDESDIGIGSGLSPIGKEIVPVTGNTLPSLGVIFLLWLVGLVVWFTMFMPKSFVSETKQRPTVTRKKSSDICKDV